MERFIVFDTYSTSRNRLLTLFYEAVSVVESNTRQAQRRAAAETPARKLNEDFIHMLYVLTVSPIFQTSSKYSCEPKAHRPPREPAIIIIHINKQTLIRNIN